MQLKVITQKRDVNFFKSLKLTFSITSSSPFILSLPSYLSAYLSMKFKQRAQMKENKQVIVHTNKGMKIGFSALLFQSIGNSHPPATDPRRAILTFVPKAKANSFPENHLLTIVPKI